MDVRHTVIGGMTFGQLTTEELIIDPNDRTRQWLCRCSCGNRKVVTERNLKHGRAKSCGCLRKAQFFSKCERRDCMYHSPSGCDYFIVNGRTRLFTHLEEGVDINSPCREYTPGENTLKHVKPFTLHKDLR